MLGVEPFIGFAFQKKFIKVVRFRLIKGNWKRSKNHIYIFNNSNGTQVPYKTSTKPLRKTL